MEVMYIFSVNHTGNIPGFLTKTY